VINERTERLGCLDADKLRNMRKGEAPNLRKGVYAGDELSVDHIIPVNLAPELGNVIANLELMLLRMNAGKKDVVGARREALAKQLNKAGLLSNAVLKAVAEHEWAPRTYSD